MAEGKCRDIEMAHVLNRKDMYRRIDDIRKKRKPVHPVGVSNKILRIWFVKVM